MFAILRHWFDLSRTAYERRRTIDRLERLSDAQLLDVGLERGTIEDHVRGGLPWQPYEPAAPQRLSPSLQGCG